MLDAHPDAELSLSIVWVDVLSSDSAVEAGKSAGLFDDPRVRQFHDSARKAGRAFAPHTGLDSLAEILERAEVPAEKLYARFQKDFVHGSACVFDSVFVFGADTTWDEAAPAALDWATQLDPDTYTGIDRGRWFWGDDFRGELARLATAHLTEPVPVGD